MFPCTYGCWGKEKLSFTFAEKAIAYDNHLPSYYNGYGHYRDKDNLFFTFAEKAIMSFIGILYIG